MVTGRDFTKLQTAWRHTPLVVIVAAYFQMIWVAHIAGGSRGAKEAVAPSLGDNHLLLPLPRTAKRTRASRLERRKVKEKLRVLMSL